MDISNYLTSLNINKYRHWKVIRVGWVVSTGAPTDQYWRVELETVLLLFGTVENQLRSKSTKLTDNKFAD